MRDHYYYNLFNTDLFFSFADEEEQTDFLVAAQLIALVKYVYFVCLFV